jgi:hypothetical protein
MADKDAKLPNIITVFTAKKYSESTIREYRGCRWKSDESTDRDIKKWFPGILPESLRKLEKCDSIKRKVL